MEKKEMSMERGKFIFLCGLLIFAFWRISVLQKKVDMYESLYVDTYRQINSNSLVLDDLMDQVPQEVERISRKVAKEEGIKLFKEFGENFKKLSQEGK
jgi:hypothetical protein